MEKDSLLHAITRETFRKVRKELRKPKNQATLKSLTSRVTAFVMQQMQVYLVTIIVLLILLFTMNCAQFYYYVTSN